MLKEKAGALAGQIWEALNGTEGLTRISSWGWAGC